MKKPDESQLNLPKDVQKLADKFRKKRLDKARIEKEKKLKAKKDKKALDAKRLKEGLVYAKEVFEWAENFRKNKIGKEFLEVSHVPTAYCQVFFFNGKVPDTEWMGLGISTKGMRLTHGGRWAAMTMIDVYSAEDLAREVDTRILKEASEWIKNGKAWKCIIDGFDYLKKWDTDY